MYKRTQAEAINYLTNHERDVEVTQHRDITIVTYTKEVGTRGDRPHIQIWKGRKAQPFAVFYFESAIQRQAKIDGEKELANKRFAFQQSELKPNILKVGDILVYSWGWEQTNIDFFQVVSATEKSVGIRAINSMHTEDSPTSMTGKAEPLRDVFVNSTVLSKRVNDDGKSVRMDYGNARLWDGTPQRYSSYA